MPLRQSPDRGEVTADIVGPVCQSGDFLALSTTGASGFVQASDHNPRPKPAEVLVEGDKWRVVRAHESLEDLVRGE